MSGNNPRVAGCGAPLKGQPSEDYPALRSNVKRPFCLWIGVLNPHKKPLEVIEIARMTPEIDFVMIGWPKNKLIADQLVAEKPANLFYLGAVTDALKEELINKCCAGLTTSTYEGFGLTPSEFLSAGKPVLAYPLDVFREIYGDLIIYVNGVDEFARHLKYINNDVSYVTVDKEAVSRRLAVYDLEKAASRLALRLDVKTLFVFAQDVSISRDAIAGNYLLEWRLWKAIKENGIELHIFANGGKFSGMFDLTEQTTQVGRIMKLLSRLMEMLELSAKRSVEARKKVLDLSILVLEPLCYVFRYIVNGKLIPSSVIIATGHPQTLAAAILKRLFGLKVVCLVHDARLYKYDWPQSSLPMKMYSIACAKARLRADLIILVSETVRKELLNYYPYPDKLMVIWTEFVSKDPTKTFAQIRR